MHTYLSGSTLVWLEFKCNQMEITWLSGTFRSWMWKINAAVTSHLHIEPFSKRHLLQFSGGMWQFRPLRSLCVVWQLRAYMSLTGWLPHYTCIPCNSNKHPIKWLVQKNRPHVINCHEKALSHSVFWKSPHMTFTGRLYVTVWLQYQWLR